MENKMKIILIRGGKMKLKIFAFSLLILTSIGQSIDLTGFYGWDTGDKTKFRGISGAWKLSGNLSIEVEGAIFGKSEKSFSGGFIAGTKISDVSPYLILGTGWKDLKVEDKEKMERFWSYGGGVKLRIFEKLWLRFDYRNMKFSSEKRYRLYGGVTYVF